jgi:hypothetical protein
LPLPTGPSSASADTSFIPFTRPRSNADLGGASQRALEGRLKLNLADDLAADVADQAAEPRLPRRQ